MALGSGTLTEIYLEPEGQGGRITCPPGLRPSPGQYLAACGPDPYEPLPVALFPSAVEGEELRIAPPLPPSWSAGIDLSLRGPLGHGFRLPQAARRVALASLSSSPARLLPLAAQALRQRAAVAIYAHRIPAGLPAEVEVLPPDLLPEAPAWADFLALETNQPGLPVIRSRLGLNPFQQPACPVQVLVVTAMPCSGVGACGVCAVAVHNRRSGGGSYALACTEGPVFDFHQLDGA